MIPTIYRIAFVAAFLVTTFVAGCVTGREQVQDKWDADKTARIQSALQSEQSARAKEQSMQTQLNEAQNAATEREKKLRADYDAVRASALGLRDTVAALRRGLPAAPADASRSTADAALAVFGECASEVGRLAEAADGHASDVRTMTEAWPK